MGIFNRRKRIHFNIATLKKNDITILTLDERWNKLFQIIPISAEVKKRQDSLNRLLAQESRLYQEKNSIEPEKKKVMNTIMSLTTEAFEKNNEDAKLMLQKSKQRIEALNKRSEELEEELFAKQEEIRNANFRLLEGTVRHVYSVMLKSRRKELMLEKEIDSLKKKLKELQTQRQSISTDWTVVYSFFHALLGAEELTKLDQLFLKSEVESYEISESGSNEKN
ncbi:MAG: hypothetical protein QM315_06365 [Bacillota bacterium]|jgi:uncharacterized protein (DUF3084 family)|nr:hypothetical protein [Bacillota bacterium]